jgi:serine phosphatase RsbU (regulator of sigma subunit)
MMPNDAVVDDSQDWVLACDVQQRFMQGVGRTSDSVVRSAQCRQVRALGGDCYDFVPLTGHRLGLVVGDASGKGVAAAVMIASVQSSLRTAALFTGNDPANLPKIVNLQAYASSLADRYAAVFYGVFDMSLQSESRRTQKVFRSWELGPAGLHIPLAGLVASSFRRIFTRV